jgi:hypothetical protein
MRFVLLFCLWLAAVSLAEAQVEITGRLHYRQSREGRTRPMTEIRAFAALAGSETEARSFRTWEMEPTGWFRFVGDAGRYTILFTEPGHWMRPLIVTNVTVDDHLKLSTLRPEPRFAYATFAQDQWDTKPAQCYWQPFPTTVTSVTHVGLQLATDGIDGVGPKSRDLLMSVHKITSATPESWPQIGPEMPVVEVDCGGPKSYSYSAGWNSGEVPLVAGERYAIRVRPRDPQFGLQAFWTASSDEDVRCWRQDSAGTKQLDRQLWLTVAGDGDGLLLPLNKRVHKRFGEFAGMSRTWTQTYVAQGEGLAGVVCYAAVSGAQPPLSRQRVLVTVRESGPDGPVVGIPKIGIGDGHYTGDASWGVFGAVFEPGEISLTPGQTYAIEMQSIEDETTVGGFVNIKGQVSDGRGAFNPYRKHADDSYDAGTAFRDGKTAMPFDLDMQVIEYAAHRTDWHEQTKPIASLTSYDAWQLFGEGHDSSAALVITGSTDRAISGGYVQAIGELSSAETYCVRGRMRSTWPFDTEHACRVGWDPTGQTANPDADTVRWFAHTPRHGQWIDFESPPLRPQQDTISIWLRGTTRAEEKFTFRAEFDALTVSRFVSDVPGPQ